MSNRILPQPAPWKDQEVMPDLAWAGLALAAFGVWLANRPAG